MCQAMCGCESHCDSVFKEVESDGEGNCASGYCLSQHRGDSQQSSHIKAVTAFFCNKAAPLILYNIYFICDVWSFEDRRRCAKNI